jgi:hypothetical protein
VPRPYLNQANVIGAFQAADMGLLAVNFDPVAISSATALATSGVLSTMLLRTDVPITVTNLHAHVNTAGATLTSGQNFGAIYSSARALLGQTVDQSVAWASVGFKTMALASTVNVPVGYFYVSLWSNATTRPAFSRGANSSAFNGPGGTNLRFRTSDSAITTTAPSSLGTPAAMLFAYWAGVS